MSISDVQVLADEISCSSVKIGNNSLNQKVNCQNDAAITAMARAMVTANADAATGLNLGIGDSADSNSDVDVQSAIENSLQARCDAVAAISTRGEVLRVGKIFGNDCSIFNNSLDQKYACINNVQEQLTTDDTIDNSADASTGLGDLSKYVLPLCIGIAIVILALAVFAYASKDTRPKVGDDMDPIERALLAPQPPTPSPYSPMVPAGYAPMGPPMVSAAAPAPATAPATAPMHGGGSRLFRYYRS